jgi:hypothetical protein
MKQEWDKNDWQGRSEKKVKSNESVAAMAMLALAAILLFAFLMNILYNL